MAQADAFLAEVSLGNANVMFELGAARSLFHGRPTILLAHSHPDTGSVELPADLGGLLRVEYRLDMDIPNTADYLDSELRKNISVAALLNDTEREHFVSARRLSAGIAPIALPADCLIQLVEHVLTKEGWRKAKPAEIAKILSERGQDPDVAELLVAKIRKSLGV